MTLSTLDDVLSYCDSLGMRMSQQRRSILELLWHSHEHLSAREIYQRLAEQGKQISPTAVFQNVAALSEKGLIEVTHGPHEQLYSKMSEPHSHINCLDTRQIIDVQVDLPDEVLDEVERKTGIHLTEYRIEFFGYRHQNARSQP